MQLPKSALLLALLAGAPVRGDVIIGNYPPTNDSGGLANISTQRRSTVSFTIPASTGYTVSSVTLRLQNYLMPGDTAVLEIRDHTGSTSAPGPNVVGSFTAPPSGSTAIGNFVFTPVGTVTLQPGTSYWLELHGGLATPSFDWRASSPAVTPTGAAAYGGVTLSTLNGPAFWLPTSTINTFRIEGTPTSGGCCFPDGQCVVMSTSACSAAGGVFSGVVSCASVNCTQPGACCRPNGSCMVIDSGRCTSSGGVYRGNGAPCATAACALPPLLWSSAQIITAPGAGIMGEDVSETTCTTCLTGVSVDLTAGSRICESFVVPAGSVWFVNLFTTLAYETNSPLASTFTHLVARIWDRPPTDPQAAIVFGDLATNRLNAAQTVFSNIYRVPHFQFFNTDRPVMRVVADLPGVQLASGTYWIEWGAMGSALLTGPWIPPQTARANAGPFLPTGNALQFSNGTWNQVRVLGYNEGQYPNGHPVALPFTLEGFSIIGCYANCDGSSGTPYLTPNDFQCFLDKFAAADPYANCDGSTGAPTLTPNDFQCFLNGYAAGCS